MAFKLNYLCRGTLIDTFVVTFVIALVGTLVAAFVELYARREIILPVLGN